MRTLMGLALIVMVGVGAYLYLHGSLHLRLVVRIGSSMTTWLMVARRVLRALHAVVPTPTSQELAG